MNSKNMERLHLCKSMGLQRSVMDSFFSANQKIKRKRFAPPRGSCFLECKLTSQPGMVPVNFLLDLLCKIILKAEKLKNQNNSLHLSVLSETESENEFRPLDERIDEFHPKATRTLFIGNLEKTTTYHDLLNIFQRFGEIVVSFFFFFAVKSTAK